MQCSPAKLTSPRITAPLGGVDEDEGPEAGMTQVWGVERTEEIGVNGAGTVRAAFQGSIGPSALDQIPKGAAGPWALSTSILSEGLTTEVKTCGRQPIGWRWQESNSGRYSYVLASSSLARLRQSAPAKASATTPPLSTLLGGCLVA